MIKLALLAILLPVAAEDVAVETEPAAPTAPAEPSSSTAPAGGTAAALAPAAAPPAEATPPQEGASQAPSVVDPVADWYGVSYPDLLRILALPVARTVPKEGFEFVLDHRAAAPIYNKDSAHPFADMGNSFFGLDQSMAVGLGLRYGIIDMLDAGIYRVGGSQFDTYELDARFAPLRQEQHQIDLMLRAGGSWFVVPNHADALWPFAQAFASRLLWKRLLLTAGVMYHANSSSANSLSSPYYTQKYRDEEHKWSVAGAVGVEYRVAETVALDVETVSCVAGFCTKNPAFSAGVKYLTFRHSFALVCGNTQYLTADGYITNTDTPWSKLVIGFNITREY
jgi:hypothetical protein